MYLQITTKCNMKCGHCCFSCEPNKGSHMTLKTFRKALKLCDEYVVLGGGEPTIHPYFEQILCETIGSDNISEKGVLVITNGKRTSKALLLAELANKQVINAELSQDSWHEPVNKKVVSAFGKRIRNVDSSYLNRPFLAGRYLETVGLDNKDAQKEACVCDDYIIQPDGNIKQCGCINAPIIGNVINKNTVSYFGQTNGMCHRSSEFRKTLKELEGNYGQTRIC